MITLFKIQNGGTKRPEFYQCIIKLSVAPLKIFLFKIHFCLVI